MNVDLVLMRDVSLKLSLAIICCSMISCAVSNNPLRKETKLLQRGVIKDDTSYVYILPFKDKKKHLLVQGYFGVWSHKERAALDFKMKRGTPVLAARDGIVVRVKEDGTKGGWSKKYASQGNNIVIQHSDGFRSGYWHLKKDGALVNVGDTVKQGQVIGLSGKTGYASMPHLHFIVWRNSGGNWQQIPTRFQTSKGIRYLKPWKWYRNKRKASPVTSTSNETAAKQ